MPEEFIFRCRGHPNVRGEHPSTFEVTSDPELTPSGTCIIGTGSETGAAGLPEAFKKELASEEAVLQTTLTVGGISVIIRSEGSSEMTLDHPTDMVWRRSSYVCGRTVGIYSDHVARDMPRQMIDALRRGDEMTVRMQVVRERVPEPSVPLLQVLFHTDE